MATYEPRSAWTSSKPGGAQLPASAVDEINVHYPAAGNVTLAGASRESVIRRLQGYRAYHISGRGWSDIGYNMAIDQAGRIWELRGLGRVGAHAASPSNPNQNRHSLGVLFLVGNNEQPTAAAINAFRRLRADILKRSPKATLVRGHGKVPGASTACPGKPLLALVADGTLTGQPRPERGDDDMPSAKEIADAVWAHPSSIEQVYRGAWTRQVGSSGKSAGTLLLELAADNDALLARVGALEATVAKLATGQSLSAEEITSAARVGAGQALDDKITRAEVNLVVGDGE